MEGPFALVVPIAVMGSHHLLVVQLHLRFYNSPAIYMKPAVQPLLVLSWKSFLLSQQLFQGSHLCTQGNI
jgi:hypothetical protein